MEPITATLPALAIASIWCLYNTNQREQECQIIRRKRQRERVAYLLWTMLQEVEDREET